MRTFQCAAAVALALGTSSLQATCASAATVILVGVFGVDNATCGPVQPCRTLQHAIDRAAAGDTIFLGNPIDYGPATIAKAVSITTGGLGAGIYSPSVPCITVNGGANDVISISGVTCDQAGAARDGIVFNSGKRLDVSDVVFRRGGGTACGIRFRPNTDAFLSFSDIEVTEWGAGGGCVMPRSGADVIGVISRANFQDDGLGILSVAGTGSQIAVTCIDCHMVGGGTGIRSTGATSAVRVGDSRISDNAVGLYHSSGGQIISTSGNSVTGNTTDGAFTSVEPPT